jgi:tetratricopeptide (TPR) repeat protein
VLWLRSSPTTKRVIDPAAKSQRNHIISAHFHTAWTLSCLSRHYEIVGEKTKSAAVDPAAPVVEGEAAEVLWLLRAPERALEECELAIALDRNLPWAHANAGVVKMMIGRCEETEADIVEATRLSPRDPALGSWYRMMGFANVFLGRYDRAVEQVRRSLSMNPQIPLTHFVLAAALALKGCIAEAAEARDAGLKLDPNFSVARYRKDRRSDNPVFLQQRERMYEGLRKAGVPEER